MSEPRDVKKVMDVVIVSPVFVDPARVKADIEFGLRQGSSPSSILQVPRSVPAGMEAAQIMALKRVKDAAEA